MSITKFVCLQNDIKGTDWQNSIHSLMLMSRFSDLKASINKVKTCTFSLQIEYAQEWNVKI